MDGWRGVQARDEFLYPDSTTPAPQQVADRHYDPGNDIYIAMLDPSMVNAPRGSRSTSFPVSL